MKIKVELELNDSDELGGLSNFVKEIEKYRAMNAQVAAVPQAVAPTEPVAQPAQQPVAEQQDEAQVVGSIAPKITEAELNQAALKYVEKNGMDKALALVRTFGVAKMPELKDPTKIAELYQQLLEGAK